MDVLDKFFTKYSYKFPKGYPDLKDKQDILLMESILGELGVKMKLKESLGYGDLQKKYYPKGATSDLAKKYNTRGERFIEKIKKGEPLVLTDNSTVIIDLEASQDSFDFNTFMGELIDIDGKKYKINKTKSDFSKTPEFGGQEDSGGTEEKPSGDTDTKESLVIVFFNILKEEGELTDFQGEQKIGAENKNWISNFKTIDSSNNLWDNIDPGVKSKIESQFKIGRSLTSPNQDWKSFFNNPYSIAKELETVYPNARMERSEYFDDIRKVAQVITGLPPDKWNPGDIYLVHKEGNFDKAIKDASEYASIQYINDLFTNDWGKTNKPLTSISLKEEKYQPGRAKSYLDKFQGGEIKYNISKKGIETEEVYIEWKDKNPNKKIEDFYKTEIDRYREEIPKLIPKDLKIEFEFPNDYPSKPKQIKSKYGAYRLLNFLLSEDPAKRILGLFSYGISLDQDLLVNPTFWKLIGKNKGTDPKKIKYEAGATTGLIPEEEIKITDDSGNGNIKMETTITKTQGDDVEKEKVSKTFRTSGGDSIQIL